MVGDRENLWNLSEEDKEAIRWAFNYMEMLTASRDAFRNEFRKASDKIKAIRREAEKASAEFMKIAVSE